MLRILSLLFFRHRHVRATQSEIKGGGDAMNEVQQGYRFNAPYVKLERPVI